MNSVDFREFAASSIQLSSDGKSAVVTFTWNGRKLDLSQTYKASVSKEQASSALFETANKMVLLADIYKLGAKTTELELIENQLIRKGNFKREQKEIKYNNIIEHLQQKLNKRESGNSEMIVEAIRRLNPVVNTQAPLPKQLSPLASTSKSTGKQAKPETSTLASARSQKKQSFQYEGHPISIIRGDITKQKVDVIVNAANEALQGGGGVDAAIGKAAGRAPYDELKGTTGSAGQAFITKPGNLEKIGVKHIVHAVGPRWKEGLNESGIHRKELELQNAYYNSLVLAHSNGAKSIAFPSISTGIFAFPMERAIKAASLGIKKFFTENPDSTLEITWVLYDEKSYNSYQDELPKYFK